MSKPTDKGYTIQAVPKPGHFPDIIHINKILCVIYSPIILLLISIYFLEKKNRYSIFYFILFLG